MAKRKAAKRPARKNARARAAGASRSRTKRSKKATRARTAKKKAGPSRKAKPTRSASSTRSSARSRAVAKPKKKQAKKVVRSAAPPRSRTRVRREATPGVAATTPRRAPALDRVRRTIAEDDFIPTPPSSLDLDRSASAVRSGRKGMKDRFDQHTETSPALTGGDIDADWESAYSVGDEAPGGDNPTPDQDIVDDIGRAVGVEYEDNEELKGEEKIAKRDRNRWELDPASAEDYPDHDED